MNRHAEEGLFSEERNREHVNRVDLPNYDLVTLSRTRADLVINLIAERYPILTRLVPRPKQETGEVDSPSSASFEEYLESRIARQTLLC